jgi:hypothetical protein
MNILNTRGFRVGQHWVENLSWCSDVAGIEWNHQIFISLSVANVSKCVSHNAKWILYAPIQAFTTFWLLWASQPQSKHL